ncbi:thioredoxin family protein [Rhodocaloribacter sp.]
MNAPPFLRPRPPRAPVPRVLPLLLACVMGAVAPAGVLAQTLEWRSFPEAVAAARKSGKAILVDVYAPWCGWCRKMQTEVYTLPELRKYLHEHFETARLNLEEYSDTVTFKGYTLTSAELAMGLGASSTPTTVFLEPDGAYITRLPGFHEGDVFMRVLRFIGTGAYRRLTYEEFLAKEHDP